MSNKFSINKVAVLGSGVMGAQIAAHFSNAQIIVNLFDLKSNNLPPNTIIQKSLSNLTKINPNPLASKKFINYITPANYDDNLAMLKECDLVIEAIAERIDFKEDLYKKIIPFLKDGAILASNTSGLSIAQLSSILPENLQKNFCGIHFFNPPRYMPLVEIIPHKGTNHEILPELETFLVSTLGKSVLIAKDTPNFIANRLGTFSMILTTIYADKFDIPFEVVDELTGKNLGRAKSATFRTADLVGLDVYSHVVNTMSANCGGDGFTDSYNIPEWMSKLITSGKLGAKTKAGIYLKDKDSLKVINPNSLEYRVADKKADKDIVNILKIKGWSEKFNALKKYDTSEAKFILACFCNSFHYAACMLGEISDSPRDMDMALRLGFAWKEGLFEIWQQIGWLEVANWISSEIANGNTISSRPIPNWVFSLTDGPYKNNQYYSVKESKYRERTELDVYKKQIFPDIVLNETYKLKKEILFSNESVVLWKKENDNIAVLSFKTKMCTIGAKVLEGLSASIDIAEEHCAGMVIWQDQDIFSAGANLEEFGTSIIKEGTGGIDKIIKAGHNIIAKKVRYSNIPIIAAVKGYAFGGGCELMLHCDGVVAALESYIGLVEAGVGLIPGWGGSTEMAYRAANSFNPEKDFENRYKTLAMARVSSSAYEAIELGFLKETDTIVMNSKEVLYIAIEKAKFLANSNYRPPLPSKFRVLGQQGLANIKGGLVNMLAGQQISEYDMVIAENLAIIMCGDEIESGTLVSQDWLLNLEKEKFKILATNFKTQARIMYMLKTGKPLRN